MDESGGDLPPVTRVRSAGDRAAKLFPDANEMKDSLREQVVRRRYDVSNYYHDTGFTQWIARHPRFENFTLVVIGLNALWIWIDTDFNPGDMILNSPPVFQFIEYSFCVYFAFEWSMRFCAFKGKCNCLKDSWFVFDTLLVLSMILETWLMTAVFLVISSTSVGGLGNASILRIARLLRLMRMARMLRLLRSMPELVILLKGMVAGMRSVGFTLGLLILILYIFGIAFVQLCSDSECKIMFPDVPNTMHSLLLNVALSDGLPDLIQPLQEQSLFLMIMLYVYVIVAVFTLMNMLIGVICEVVTCVAASERESLNLNFVRDKIEELMGEGSEVGRDVEALISKNELLQLLTNEKAVSILQDVGVDVVGLVDFADTIFAADPFHTDGNGEFEEKKLTFREFMGLVLDLRGGNNATVRDMVNMRKYIDGRFSRLEERLLKGHASVFEIPDLKEGEAKLAALKLEVERQVQAYSCLMQNALGSSPGKPEVQSFDFFQNMRNLLTFHESEVAVMRTENRLLHEQTELVSCTITPGRRPWAPARATTDSTDTVISPVSPTRVAPNGVSYKPMVSILPLPAPDLVRNKFEVLSNSTASPRWPDIEVK